MAKVAIVAALPIGLRFGMTSAAKPTAGRHGLTEETGPLGEGKVADCGKAVPSAGPAGRR